MDSKCGAVTTTNYEKLESATVNSEANGIVNEIVPENDEGYPEVFSDTESRKNSSQENTLEKPARKRSVLKRNTTDGSRAKSAGLQKTVSFSSVPSERRRRVSSG